MRSLVVLHAGLFFLTLLRGPAFAATDAQRSVFDAGTDESAASAEEDPTFSLLVEVTPDGSPGQVMLVETSPEEIGERDPEWVLNKAWGFGGIDGLGLPFYGAFRVGLQSPNGILELGGEARLGFVMVIPFAASVGGYIQLHPIPGEVGKRFYLYGKTFGVFSLLSKPSAWAGAGVGVRAFDVRLAGTSRPKWASFEVGLAKVYSGEPWYCKPSREDCPQSTINLGWIVQF